LRFRISNLNDTLFIFDTIPTGIQSGQTLSFSTQLSNPLPGNNQLEIYADEGNIIQELSELNNNEDARLCYDFLLFGSGGQRPLGIFNPGVTLANQAAFTANPVSLLFEISGPGISGWDVIGTATAYQVSGYTNQSVSCPNSYGLNVTGVYTIRVTADPENYFIECDESNNQTFFNITVVNQADYFVASYHIEPSKLNPEPGEAFHINVSYLNNGNNNTGDTMTVGIKVDNQQVAVLAGIGLQHGDHSTVQAQNLSINSIGLHVIRAVIDQFNHVIESNEQNNEATRTLLVGQYPNLKFISVTPNDLSPEAGQLLVFNFAIQNEGDTACQAQIYWTYNGNKTMGISTIAIPANETVFFEEDSAFQWIVSDPNASIKAEIRNSNPQEYNTDDNSYELGLNGIVASVQTEKASCPNATDGVASIQVSGGIGNYNYVWSIPEAGSAASYNSFAPGNYTVLISDEATPMHQTSLSFTIDYIADDIAPMIQNARDTSIYAFDGICPVVVHYHPDFLPIVTDNCDQNPSLQISPVAGQGLAPGVYPLIFTATDAWGNVSSVTKTLTVAGNPEVFAGVDQELCILETNLAALEIPGNFPNAVGTWTLQSGQADFNPNNIQQNNLALSNLGQQSVLMRWTVQNGNCPVVYDEVSIHRDIISPQAICRNFTVYLGPDTSATVSGGTIGNDSEDNCYVDHFSIEELVFDCDHLGESLVELIVYDGALNSSSCTAVITVVDTLGLCDFDGDGYPPGVDCDDTNASIHPNAEEICNDMDDDCDGLIDANDPDYEDTVAPSINCPDDIIEIASSGQCERIVSYNVNASDACGSASISYSLASGTSFNVGITNITVIATDENQNSSSCTFAVTILDAEPPLISCPNAILDSTTFNSCVKEISYTANATDNCGIASVVYTPPSGSNFNIGTHAVVVTATDEHGNTNECTFTVVINARTEICNGKDDDCDGQTDEGFDFDSDGIADCFDNCRTVANANQADSDCDGVGNGCDICPGADDSIDVNQDGKPDCKYPPALADIIPEWKCGGGAKVIVCHKAKTTICVNYAAVQTHINNGSYLGPCNHSNCGGTNLIYSVDGTASNSKLETLEKSDQIYSDNDLWISPNPVRDILFLEFRNSVSEGTIRIISSEGVLLFEQALVEKTNVFPIDFKQIGSNWSSGVYFLLFEDARQRIVKKFALTD